MAELRGDVSKTKEDLAALLLQMKECCKNDTLLAALVAAGTQDQLAGVRLQMIIWSSSGRGF